MLRPIDVIFKHPVKKFTVIYQNGKLWQLPRIDFDGQSLRYKKIYRGSREHIFVAHDQTINQQDTLLVSQLATLDLPESVIGRNVDEFEHWWQYNWYNFRDTLKQKKQIQLNAKLALTQQTVLTQPQPQPQPQHTISPNTSKSSQSPKNVQPTSASGDVFDNMLAELMNNL